MCYNLRCNIDDSANQLLFVYMGLAPKLQVLKSFLTDIIKATNFILTLEKKQEI